MSEVREFKVTELENGFLVEQGERRWVSSRDPKELVRALASVLGIDVTPKKRGPRKKKVAAAA